MNGYTLVLALAMAAAATSAGAQDTGGVSLQMGWSALDAGYDDWRETALQVDRRWPGGTAYVVLRSIGRYGLRDGEVVVGGSRRFGEVWDLTAEVSGSDDADFLARHSLMIGAARKFRHGWVGSAGLRHSDYRLAQTRVGNIGVERYAGAWRLGWTGYGARVAGDGQTAWSQRIALDHYRGDEDRIGGFVAWGRQLDTVPGVGVEARSVPSAGVSGRQSLGGKWSLDWQLVWERQGALYRRTGASIGLRRRF